MQVPHSKRSKGNAPSLRTRVGRGYGLGWASVSRVDEVGRATNLQGAVCTVLLHCSTH